MTLERVLISVGAVAVGHVIGRIGGAIRDEYGFGWGVTWCVVGWALFTYAVFL